MDDEKESPHTRSFVSFGVAVQQGELIGQFIGWDEVIENAGEAQWVDFAKRHGRGTGTGVLVVTNEQFLFVLSDMSHHVSIPRIQIREFKIGRTIVPNFWHVDFDDADGGHRTFLCTKRMAKELADIKPKTHSVSTRKQSEGIRAATLVSDGQHSRWAPISMRFIDGGFEWKLVERPEAAITVEFADIVKASYEVDTSSWQITTQPHSYPEGLLKYNPAGLVESVFGRLPQAVAEQIDDGVVKSRGAVAGESRSQRTSAAIREPVDSLSECPRCGGFFRARTANTVECHICDLIFANVGVQPSIGWDAYNQWTVTGEEHWMPISESDLPFAELNLIWVASPRPELPGPLLLYEMMSEALELGGHPEGETSGY